MKNKILIAGGIVGIVGLAYYFIKKSTERGYIKDSPTHIEYGRIVEGDLPSSFIDFDGDSENENGLDINLD